MLRARLKYDQDEIERESLNHSDPFQENLVEVNLLWIIYISDILYPKDE